MLPLHCRLLGGFIAMAGLLIFAWSTTTLLAPTQRFESKQLRHIAQPPRKGGTGPGSAAS